MTGELGYMIYKTPTVVDLTFDNENKALEVADLINAKVVEEFAKVAQWLKPPAHNGLIVGSNPTFRTNINNTNLEKNNIN